MEKNTKFNIYLQTVKGTGKEVDLPLRLVQNNTSLYIIDIYLHTPNAYYLDTQIRHQKLQNGCVSSIFEKNFNFSTTQHTVLP